MNDDILNLWLEAVTVVLMPKRAFLVVITKALLSKPPVDFDRWEIVIDYGEPCTVGQCST